MAPARGARVLIGVDGLFLILSGCFGLTADLASYFAGAGPFGPVFHGDPVVIGVVEAHGLAVLTGIAAMAALAGGPRRYWHWHLAATHILLGGANIAFFEVFERVGARGGGIGVTAVHFSLVALQIAYAARGGAGARPAMAAPVMDSGPQAP
jgi:hypothetical protein